MRVAIGIVLVAAMVAAVILFVFESDDSGPPQDFRDGALSGAGTPASATGPRLPAQPSGPTPAPVAPDSTTADEPKVVEPAGTGPERDERLPRVVSDFRRMPVADARVFVKTTSGETVRYTTDQLGQIPLGEDRIQGESIRIEAPGFTLLDQSLAEGFEGKTFVLSPEAAIRVRVTDAQGLPQPWANLQIGVVIQDEHGAVLGLPWSLEKPPVTDSNGEARLAKLDPRGRYLIVATLARLGVGVAHDVVPDASGPGASVTIKLGGDGVIQVLVTSSTGESIHNARALLSGEPDRLPGRIVADPASRALADLMRAFKVRFRRSTFSYHDARFTGWRSGSGFAFDQLPPGEYVVEIEARGFKPYARKLRVGEGATVQHVAAMELEGVALTRHGDGRSRATGDRCAARREHQRVELRGLPVRGLRLGRFVPDPRTREVVNAASSSGDGRRVRNQYDSRPAGPEAGLGSTSSHGFFARRGAHGGPTARRGGI